jgi:hypothetical protein
LRPQAIVTAERDQAPARMRLSVIRSRPLSN